MEWYEELFDFETSLASYSKRLTSSPGMPSGPWEHSKHFLPHSLHFHQFQRHETTRAASMFDERTLSGSSVHLKGLPKRVFGATINPWSYSTTNMRHFPGNLSLFTDRRRTWLSGSHIARLGRTGNELPTQSRSQSLGCLTRHKALGTRLEPTVRKQRCGLVRTTLLRKWPICWSSLTLNANILTDKGLHKESQLKNVTATYFSGRASFWRDVDEKFANKNSEMRTNEIKKRKAHFKSTLTSIKRFSEILKCCFASDERFPFTILACLPWSFASCVVWDVLRPNPAFSVQCTHHLHDFANS